MAKREKWEPKVGDKVRCVILSYSTSELCDLLELGKIYTVKESSYGDHGSLLCDTWRILLEEVDSSRCFPSHFRTEDFNLVKDNDSHEDAWNRAMGVL